MASRLRESTARVYFSVCFSPAWPRSEATVLMLAPLLRRLTANEWRAQQCQVMCFSVLFLLLQELFEYGKTAAHVANILLCIVINERLEPSACVFGVMHLLGQRLSSPSRAV